MYTGSALTVSNSLIYSNRITTTSGGGGIWNDGGAVVLINDTIANNHSPLGPDGGGILIPSGRLS